MAFPFHFILYCFGLIFCPPVPVLDEIAPHGEDSGEEMDVDPEKEAFYKEDPKKALKKFFDREGLYTCHYNWP